MKTFKDLRTVNEGVDAKIASIAKMAKGNSMMNLRKPLESMFKKKDIDFVFSPVAHFRIKDGSKTIIIVNKKYADSAEVVQDELAFGYEGKI